MRNDPIWNTVCGPWPVGLLFPKLLTLTICPTYSPHNKLKNCSLHSSFMCTSTILYSYCNWNETFGSQWDAAQTIRLEL